MILIEYPHHLVSRANGSHGNWRGRAASVKADRRNALIQVNCALESFAGGYGRAFRDTVTRYAGKSKGISVTKARIVRTMLPPLDGILASGIVVTLTRIGARPLDTDNLAYAFKSIRDGVADAFGIRDDDKRIAWEYAQEKGSPAVRIEISKSGDRTCR